MSKLCIQTGSHGQTNIYEQVAAAARDEGSSSWWKDDSNLFSEFSSFACAPNIVGTNEDEKDVGAFDHSGKQEEVEVMRFASEEA
jgi:hypothetical protein